MKSEKLNVNKSPLGDLGVDPGVDLGVILTRLHPYEEYLRTACTLSYSRALTTRQMAEIAAIYQALTGDTRKWESTCSSCRIELLQKTGEIYFKYQKTIKNK